MLKWRAISFPLLLGLLWVIFFCRETFGRPLFFVCITVMATMAVYECSRMLDRAGVKTFPVAAGVFSGVLLALSSLSVLFRAFHPLFATVVFTSLFFLPWLFILFCREKAVGGIFNTVGVIVLVLLPICALAILYPSDSRQLLFIVCATKAMDTGGYIFGTLAGRLLPGGSHKICPAVSPNKSYEGALGGLAVSLLAGWGFGVWIGNMALWKYLVLSALLAAASLGGDLTESALKRRCGVKDSGNWIPGMGGALDVLDSFIYTAPVYYIFLTVANLNG